MKTEKTVPAPLYRDPIYDAPTSPGDYLEQGGKMLVDVVYPAKGCP